MTKTNLDAYLLCMEKGSDFSENLEWPFDNSRLEKRINVLEAMIEKERSILENYLS